MTEPEVVYRFTPQFAGAFLQHVPQRDLTQVDVNNMTPQEQRDAFAPHMVYGTPLYTAVKGAEVPDFSRAHEEWNFVEEVEGEIVTSPDLPKWFQARQAKAAKDNTLLAEPLPNETEKQYDERMAESLTTELEGAK